MGTVCHWQPFWSTARVRFTGQCWYFNPSELQGKRQTRASCVLNSITHWNNCAVAMCWHKWGFLEGFRRWRGSILAT